MKKRFGAGCKAAPAGQCHGRARASALVTRHGHPLFITLPFTEDLLQHGIHTALAENLYKNGVMTLGKAAKLAGLSIVDFSEHLSQAGIPVVDCPVDELADELKRFIRNANEIDEKPKRITPLSPGKGCYP